MWPWGLRLPPYFFLNREKTIKNPFGVTRTYHYDSRGRNISGFSFAFYSHEGKNLWQPEVSGRPFLLLLGCRYNFTTMHAD